MTTWSLKVGGQPLWGTGKGVLAAVIGSGPAGNLYGLIVPEPPNILIEATTFSQKDAPVLIRFPPLLATVIQTLSWIEEASQVQCSPAPFCLEAC